MDSMKKSKFCILFVLFVIAANIAAVDAQIVLKGKVTTREEEPVAFAAVSLRGMRDTTRLVETAVTDMQELRFRETSRGQIPAHDTVSGVSHTERYRAYQKVVFGQYV